MENWRQHRGGSLEGGWAQRVHLDSRPKEPRRSRGALVLPPPSTGHRRVWGRKEALLTADKNGLCVGGSTARDVPESIPAWQRDQPPKTTRRLFHHKRRLPNTVKLGEDLQRATTQNPNIPGSASEHGPPLPSAMTVRMHNHFAERLYFPCFGVETQAWRKQVSHKAANNWHRRC